MKIKRILVPTDFSDHSDRALDYAIDFARSHSAELVLVHAIEPVRYTQVMPDVSESELQERYRARAVDQLAAWEQRTKRRYRRCRSQLESGIPYEVIANAAEKLKADLIIIATHGYSGLHHLFLGSVTERVVRIAKCPVLTVRAVEAASPKQSRSRRGRRSKSSS
ncbi:MAG TPA: universal stress protein [Candidatus Binataceae bacterium]|nr:universal stress protein [Candidatus Binataceae bacterium]